MPKTETPIHISPDLGLPLDVCTQALALLGMRGVGKTHLLSVLCEELVGAGAPVAILDPLGVLWGLRSSKDGKKPGLSVIVMGGEHGDVPLEPGSGRVIADWLVAERHSCVLDLSGFRKAEQRRFVTDFGVRLYEANREPLHLVVDEADLFAPQRPRPDEMAMLGAFEDLVRRGRARGIGISLATQRPAVIHKDVLTQVGVLVALRVVGPQDRKAIEDWIEHHGDDKERKEVLSSLGSLPIGTAWFWSPGWLGVLKRVRIRDRHTFDSSATPKLGAKRVQPQQLAPVDIEALRTRIADTIERAQADNPAELRKRIAELEQELTAALDSVGNEPPPAPKVVEVPVVTEAQLGRLEVAIADFQRAAISAVEQARDIVGALPTVHTSLDVSPISAHHVARRAAKSSKPQNNAAGDFRPDPPVTRPPGIQKATNGAGAKMPTTERLILTALAQQHPKQLTRERLALTVGHHRNTKTFVNALGALRGRGAIDDLTVTDSGLRELGPFERLPTGRALIDWWCQHKLHGKEVQIIRAIQAGSNATREALAEAVGCHRNTKTFVNALGRLRGLGIVDDLQLAKGFG